MDRIRLLLLFVSLGGLTQLHGQLTFVTNPSAAGSSGQTAAGALNDAWESAQQAAHCGTLLFVPVYGLMVDDCAGGDPVGPGTILGLVQSDNLPYAGTATFQERLVNEDDSDIPTKGTAYTNACGATGGVRDDSDNTMQGEAPTAATTGMIDQDGDGNLDYYNGYAGPPNGKKWALLISFSQAVTQFGLFVGDLESRSDGQDGYPAQVVLFDGAAIVDQQNVPTATTNQSLCTGDANGDFNGCGNDETVWVQYQGAPITDILLVVGEVSSEAGANINKGSFNGLTLGGICQASMPVELAFFRAEPGGAGVDLFWETRSELDNDYFAVEHSSDGEVFQTVGKVPGAGDSFAPAAYSFTHPNTRPGRHYYRLRQVDFDGRISYGPVVAATVKAPSLQLAPALVADGLLVRWPDPLTGQARLEVYDILGRAWSAEPLSEGAQEFWLAAGDFPAGPYVVLLRQGDAVWRGRFVKQ